MTDKEIIIDGVDVSGCKLYRDDNGVFAPDGTAERTELCYLTNDYCGNTPDCYYKQLKRKEEELEQYKKSKQASYEQLQKRCNELELENRRLGTDLATLDVIVETCKAQYKELKAENEELKETIKLQNTMQIEVCNEKNEEIENLKKHLKNIAEGTLGKYCCAEEYASEVLDESN